jgi:hypothetical protein
MALKSRRQVSYLDELVFEPHGLVAKLDGQDQIVFDKDKISCSTVNNNEIQIQFKEDESKNGL